MTSRAPGWLNRTVLAIGLASLFSDVGHEMVTAAMPALLLSLGAGSVALGFIEGAADGSAALMKLVSGRMSDRLTRRKPVAVAGYVMTAVGLGSFAAVTNQTEVLVGRVVAWLGRGLRSPVRKALLAEATTPDTYGRAFGLERSMDTAGALVGPLLALLIIGLAGARWVFVVAIVPSMLAVTALAVFVQEKPKEPSRAPATSRSAYSALPAPFRRVLVAIGIAGLGDFSRTLLILWATQGMAARYGTARAATFAVGLYAGYNAVYMGSCMLAGLLADRLPKNLVLAGGYALACVPALVLLAPGAGVAKYAVVFGASGLYMGFWETVESATAAMFLPPEHRGTGFGLLDAVNGVGDMASSVIVGGLWVVSPTAAMGFVAGSALVAAAMVLRA